MSSIAECLHQAPFLRILPPIPRNHSIHNNNNTWHLELSFMTVALQHILKKKNRPSEVGETVRASDPEQTPPNMGGGGGSWRGQPLSGRPLGLAEPSLWGQRFDCAGAFPLVILRSVTLTEGICVTDPPLAGWEQEEPRVLHVCM